MSEDQFDYIIIGAGMTGLNLGRKISNLRPNSKTLVLEKAKSCGGRMATRRINENKFDHGLQFIEQTDVSLALIQNWQKKDLLKDFSTSENFNLAKNLKCAKSGITSLAKEMAEGLNIQYNFKAIKLSKFHNAWQVIGENNTKYTGQNIILTFPLPQSIDLLTSSEISFDPDLKKISYQKAIVYLVEGFSNSHGLENYQENKNEDIFSISPQHIKMNLQAQTWTIVMTEKWSDQYFEQSDEQILNLGKEYLSKNLNELKIKSMNLKKWRYSVAKTKWHSLYYTPTDRIYLAGDSFGGPDILGALASSNAICDRILQSGL